ncbi:hypothetical protein G6F37_009598 [Rhizopus arrhizus]|nr:hypothetical protein G6F38_004150 [Rhizopus arrhizus]KAG1154274.1 hypothetical protein G6F37_009598 [Rhizopus arrhizus]
MKRVSGVSRSTLSKYKSLYAPKRTRGHAGKIYNNLPVDAKTAICLGFNSTLDLSNNSKAPNSQRCLFNEDEWEKNEKRLRPPSQIREYP